MSSTLTLDEQFRARLEVARRLGALGTDARDLTELFRALHEEITRAMDATIFMFALYDDATKTVEVVRQIDRGVEHEGGSFPLGKGFTSEVIETGAPRLVRHWAAEGPTIRLLYGTESGELVAPQSGVVVPILSDARVVGVLSVQSYRPDAFEEADVLSLSAIAGQASLAIKRLRASDLLAQEYERRAQQLEAVLASMDEALLIVDGRGAIVRLNRAARKLLRLDSASLVLGQPLERQRVDQWPSTAREIAAALVPAIEAIRAGTNVADKQIELRGGDRRVLNMSASVLRSAKGAVEGGVIAFHDVTLQRDLEQLREDIFEMAWHDMQTPITVIRAYGELLLRRIEAGNHDRTISKSAATAIVRHADRLAEFLTTLFDVHCLEAGLLSIARWPTDLATIARETADAHRSTARRHIRVEGDGNALGDWDERRLRQVLMNLMTNAVKYSPDNSRITVSVSADERCATVSVRDEGIGLDQEEMARLFSRGYRAESAQRVTGRGLGLYFSQGIIAAHGGRMWAESAGHGKGSTFSFTLPLREERGAKPVSKPPVGAYA